MATKKEVSKERVSASKSTLSEEQLARLREQSKTVAGGGGIRLPVINRIAINGNADAEENEKGELIRPPVNFRKQIFIGKESDQRPEQVSLGKTLDVIFVKSRRRLVARDSQGFQVMSTSQHGHPNQVVTLWKEGKVLDHGKASDLRAKYEDLRTVQETYVLMPDGELCLLITKGAALGSKTRDEKYPDFYKYLSSLSDSGGIFAHHTLVGGVLEKGVKQFYTPVFKIGEETTPDELISVLEHSDKLTKIIEQYDEENANFVMSDAPAKGSSFDDFKAPVEESTDTEPF